VFSIFLNHRKKEKGMEVYRVTTPFLLATFQLILKKKKTTTKHKTKQKKKTAGYLQQKRK